MNKIVHMDIKEKNLVVDENLEIKLIDFSISQNYQKYKNNDQITLPTAGTSYSISPEVLESKPIYIQDLSKVDIYSFGVMIYFLAFGKFPYGFNEIKGDDYTNILHTVKNDKFEIDQSFKLSNCFCDFLEKCLKPEISERISVQQAREHPFIKGAEILLEEKEKLSNLGKFLVLLLTDCFKNFNDYQKSQKIRFPLPK